MIDALFLKKIERKLDYLFKGKYSWINDPEDIKQEVFLKYAKNGKGQTIEQALIDAIRKYYGRPGAQCHSIRKNAEIYRLEYVEEFRDIDKPARPIGHQIQCGAHSRDLEGFGERVDLNIILSKLGKFELLIYKLIEIYGFTQKDIADMLLVTEARISQRYKRIQERVFKMAEKVLEREKQRESQKGQSRQVSSSLQNGRSLQGAGKKVMAHLQREKRERVATTEIKKISEAIFSTF